MAMLLAGTIALLVWMRRLSLGRRGPRFLGQTAGYQWRVGQVQLAQPVLTLGWSALLLGEPVGPLTVATALAVLASVAATQRAR